MSFFFGFMPGFFFTFNFMLKIPENIINIVFCHFTIVN